MPTVCLAHLDSKPKAPHLQRGESTEQLACNYLQANGLKLLQQNYRLKMGEIDLIMLDGDTIVFVEVRYRKSKRYGGALYSIDPRKQMRLLRTAQYFLQSHAPNAPARFDVIAVDGGNDIHWLKNAIES